MAKKSAKIIDGMRKKTKKMTAVPQIVEMPHWFLSLLFVAYV